MDDSLKNRPKKTYPFFRTLFLFLIIYFAISIIAKLVQSPRSKPEREVPYSDLINLIKRDSVLSIEISAGAVYFMRSDSDSLLYKSFLPRPLSDFDINLAIEHNVIVKVRKPSFRSGLLITSLFLILILLVVFVIIRRQVSTNGVGPLSQFLKSRAKMVSNGTGVTFADVAGCDEAKKELEQIVDFLKIPEKFTRLGGHVPKGTLLVGPPGTGKTLLAKAVAGEAGRPFFSIAGSDFIEMFVGVGARRVVDLFEQAKASAPCIVYVDEIDGLGKRSGGLASAGHSEQDQTITQFLSEMDGFESIHGVIFIASTNKPEALDVALLRPGRFDRQVIVDLPDLKGRIEILKVHAKKIRIKTGREVFAKDVNFEDVARGMPGASGAELANILNEAALRASPLGKEFIDNDDLTWARDKVVLGLERTSLLISDEEKKTTAYHEAGHALVSIKVPGNDPVSKVTIIPRGRALGVTQNLPIGDRHNYTKKFILAKLRSVMGGRAAEEIVFGKDNITTGAEHDFEQATYIAKQMVCSWGMSELGQVVYFERDRSRFLAGWGRELECSPETEKKIDETVKKLIDEAYSDAKKVLEDNRKILDELVLALLAKETLDGEEVMAVVNRY